LYLCFEENPVIYDLRKRSYAVGKVNSYKEAKKLILEAAKYINGSLKNS